MTTGTEDAPQAPAWGASVSAVRDLVLDVAAEGRRIAQAAPRIGDDRVAAYLEEAAALVGVRTATASRLPAADLDGWALALPEVDTYRRHLCELYAAALLADVTHPQLARDGRSPGQPLRERYERELDALVVAVDTALTTAPDTDPATPGHQTGGAAIIAPLSPRIRARRF